MDLENTDAVFGERLKMMQQVDATLRLGHIYHAAFSRIRFPLNLMFSFRSFAFASLCLIKSEAVGSMSMKSNIVNYMFWIENRYFILLYQINAGKYLDLA